MKTIIYIRTSTEEQEPKNQIAECERLAESLNIKDIEIIEEQKSAYKDEKKRTEFNKILDDIKKGRVSNIICWDLDRLYRNRKKLLEFFQICKLYSTKIYSCRQQFINEMQNLKLPTGFEFIKDMMTDNFLQFLGWIAEEESSKKSERVKLAVRRGNGKTKSYKGNKWGRRTLSKKTIKEVLELSSQGLKIREIASRVTYWDKNKNQKHISVGAIWKIINVHKILAENKGGESGSEVIQESVN